MCRIYALSWTNTPRDIAIDEATALLIDSSGNGTVVGSGTVYFMQAGAPQICQSKTPLTYQNVSVYRIQQGASFNLSSWTGTGGIAYSVSANAGVLSSTQAGGNIY